MMFIYFSEQKGLLKASVDRFLYCWNTGVGFLGCVVCADSSFNTAIKAPIVNSVSSPTHIYQKVQERPHWKTGTLKM